MMSYPPIPPKKIPSPPKRRPTYGDYLGGQYGDDFNNNNYSPLPPRRKPVPPPPKISTADHNGSSRPSAYGAPPVSGHHSAGPIKYEWPPEAQQVASGYDNDSTTPGGLVYPEEFVYVHPTPTPAAKNQSSIADGLYGEKYDDVPKEVDDNYRPLPPRPEQSP